MMFLKSKRATINKSRATSNEPRAALWRWTKRIVLGFFAISILQVASIRFIHPVATPLMIGRWIGGLFSKESVGLDYRWRSLEEISPNLLRAVIASEDGKFFEHNGFDFDAIERAQAANHRHKRVKGASTITMQCARNLFLWQSRNWIRKGLEAYYTVLMEFLLPKKRILELYVNVIEWGNGVYGAEAGAMKSFHTDAKRLSIEQSALMAAVLPNPRRWLPGKPTAYIRSRSATISARMNDVSLESLR